MTRRSGVRRCRVVHKRRVVHIFGRAGVGGTGPSDAGRVDLARTAELNRISRLVRGQSALVSEGLTKREIDAGCSTGRLHRLRPGRYVDGMVWARLGMVDRHALLVLDLLVLDRRSRAVVSHVSAAVLHGLDLPLGADLSRVHLTWPGSAGRAPTCNLSPHRAVIDRADITGAADLSLTTVSRTVYDLARSEDQLLSVVVADAALRDGRCTRDEFATTLERAAGRPGSALAQQVMAFADPLAATGLQSRARVLMARAGLPTPGLAATIDHPWGWEMGPFHFVFDAQHTVAMVVDDADPLYLDRVGVQASLRQAGFSIAWIRSGDLTGPREMDRRMAEAFASGGLCSRLRRTARLLPGRADSISGNWIP